MDLSDSVTSICAALDLQYFTASFKKEKWVSLFIYYLHFVFVFFFLFFSFLFFCFFVFFSFLILILILIFNFIFHAILFILFFVIIFVEFNNSKNETIRREDNTFDIHPILHENLFNFESLDSLYDVEVLKRKLKDSLSGSTTKRRRLTSRALKQYPDVQLSGTLNPPNMR